MLDLLRAMRPAQWVKNLFVLLPALFAKAHTAKDPTLLGQAGLGVLAFLLLSSAVYLMNDVLDADRDRLHPVRRHRPIASGALSIPAAVTGALASLVGAYAIGYALGGEFSLAATAYLAINVAYSGGLKRVAWVDVLCIAIGFVVRVLAGCSAIRLEPSEISYYLIGCTFLGALFLALGKRRHELASLGDAARRSLGGYRKGTLDAAMIGVGAATLGVYVLYTFSGRTLEYFGTHRLAFMIPFVAFGIVRFLGVVRRPGETRSPTDVILRDVPFLANSLVWVGVALWAVYWQPE